jgi:hypothetical protein
MDKNLSVCICTPSGTGITEKDIDSFIKVLQIPLYATEVVSQLVGGPVDFFPCCYRGVLEELRPSLKQSLGSVDCFLYLSVIKGKEKKKSHMTYPMNK